MLNNEIVNGVKEFISGLIKLSLLIASVILVVYGFFTLADFVKLKFNIDLYEPASLIGSIAILILAGIVMYRRIMSLIKSD